MNTKIARDPKTNEACLVVSQRNAPGVVLVGPPARYLLADLYHRSSNPEARVSVYAQAESGDLLQCDVRGSKPITSSDGRMTREWEVVLSGSGETVEWFVSDVATSIVRSVDRDGVYTLQCICGWSKSGLTGDRADTWRGSHAAWHATSDYQVASDGYAGD